MSENLNSLSEPNKTLEESPNSNFSSQVSSPAAAANWIKNAIQSPHSQNKTPHDLFTDFESLKSPPSDPNLTSKSATTYSRLQTLSGSSPLRTKILQRSLSSKLSSEMLENESSLKSEINLQKKITSQSTFSLQYSTGSISSLKSNRSFIQSTASISSVAASINFHFYLSPFLYFFQRKNFLLIGVKFTYSYFKI
ncbi:hypothetical protein HMI56_004552 [Coelomomyces lativittatus]|nr:hypothetical protein HMI56_004552 [Coelomomyces lativittatus]